MTASSSQPNATSAGPLDIYVTLTHADAVPGVDILVGGASPQVIVVLKNIGSTPIRLWKETCSWGYRNLSFDMTDQSGRQFVVTRLEIGWEKNIPEWDTLTPGDSVSREVTFNASDWRGLPELKATEPRSVKMRALYKSADSYQSQLNHVWVGSASSVSAEVTLANHGR